MPNFYNYFNESDIDAYSLENYVTAQFPRSPTELWNMEAEIQAASAKFADQVTSSKIKQLHEDGQFVKDAVNNARQNSADPLINKGWKTVSILLMGGMKVIIHTPYLRKNWKKITGRTRRKRGKSGSGIYPVLQAIGIKDRVSPATRDEIALLTVQAASYQEAIQMLARRGISCSTSTLERIATATAQADISLRDIALSSAMDIAVPADGPLAGKRVRIGIDGGRTRTRKNKKGRKTKKGRHRFETPWREPRILVIDLLDEAGGYDSIKLPLYDVLIDDADATFYLLIGYLRLLGAAHAEVVEFISDGAEWIWDRVDQMRIQAEIPETKFIKILDFYHASEHLSEAVELCKNLSSKERKKLYKKLRHILRHKPKGIEIVIEKLKQMGEKHQLGEDMISALKYFEKHIKHMAYANYVDMKLPIGSGQVESAVRRVINLRFKAPGTFWNEKTAEKLMHLRAFFKVGRWNELMQRLLTERFLIPYFG